MGFFFFASVVASVENACVALGGQKTGREGDEDSPGSVINEFTTELAAEEEAEEVGDTTEVAAEDEDNDVAAGAAAPLPRLFVGSRV